MLDESNSMFDDIISNIRPGKVAFWTSSDAELLTSLGMVLIKHELLRRKHILYFSLAHEKKELKSKFALDEVYCLEIDDTVGINVEDVREKCLECNKKKKLDLIIIDHFLLLSDSIMRSTRGEEHNNIATKLVELAEELQASEYPFASIVVYALLPKTTEKRRFDLNGFREYGNEFDIKKVADTIFYIEYQKCKWTIHCVLLRQKLGHVKYICEDMYQEAFELCEHLDKCRKVYEDNGKSIELQGIENVGFDFEEWDKKWKTLFDKALSVVAKYYSGKIYGTENAFMRPLRVMMKINGDERQELFQDNYCRAFSLLYGILDTECTETELRAEGISEEMINKIKPELFMSI